MRILAAPVFFVLYFIPKWFNIQKSLLLTVLSLILLPLLAFAEFTDFLDGYSARKHGEVSDFGKMFDPFADVFLHLSTFTCFVFSGYMPALLYVLILYREFSQNFLRMVAAKNGTAIAARKGGKFKTVMYVASGFFALFLETLVRFGIDPANFATLQTVSLILFIICVVCSYVSFIDYLIHFGKLLKE